MSDGDTLSLELRLIGAIEKAERAEKLALKALAKCDVRWAHALNALHRVVETLEQVQQTNMRSSAAYRAGYEDVAATLVQLRTMLEALTLAAITDDLLIDGPEHPPAEII